MNFGSAVQQAAGHRITEESEGGIEEPAILMYATGSCDQRPVLELDLAKLLGESDNQSEIAHP